MLSRGHPELDAMVGAAQFRIARSDISNAALRGQWTCHVECQSDDGTWTRRPDLSVDLPMHAIQAFLVPGTRIRLVIENDLVTKVPDWSKFKGWVPQE